MAATATGATGEMAGTAPRAHTVTRAAGLRLHVREWGRADGPAIMFIHGWSQSHLCWARQYDKRAPHTDRPWVPRPFRPRNRR